MSPHALELRRDGAVQVVTLNRPEVLNAMNDQMMEELTATFVSLCAEPAVRSVVLTGAGRAFSAGGDVSNMGTRRTSAEVRANMLDTVLPMARAIRQLQKPVVAAVNGLAYGAGFSLALLCDLVVAAESASFSQVFSRRGLVPDAGSTYMLTQAVGPWRAKELMFRAMPISAKEGLDLGFVNQVQPHAEVLSAAMALAHELAEGPGVALGLIKSLVDGDFDSSLGRALTDEAAAQALCIDSEDHREGVQAFHDRRPPVFTGR